MSGGRPAIDDFYRRWIVYRLRSVSGRLLYVGKTYEDGFESRLKDHRAKVWGWLIFSWDPFDYYGSEQEALDAELYAIRTEQPLANVAGQWQRGRAFDKVLRQRMVERRIPVSARKG